MRCRGHHLPSRVALVLALLVAGLAALRPGRSAATAGTGPQRVADAVVLLSLDGVRWDYPSRARAAAFERMAREGGSATALIPPFPASTFPSHVTLATGVYPDRHGIINNRFLDRARGLFDKEKDASWILSEPVWVTAERQGIRAAVDGWVGCGTPWQGVLATDRRPYARGTPDAATIDGILRWLRRGPALRPGLILAYLHGADAAGHAQGPDSPAVLERMRILDRLLDRLLRGARESGLRVTVLVVSDHGMAPVSRVISLRRLLGRCAAGVRALSSGAVSNLYCRDAAACGAARAALTGVPGLQVEAPDRLPAELHGFVPGRSGDLILRAPAGAVFSDAAGGEGRERGAHGYGPDDHDMWGVFYAWGAGIRAGARRDRIEAIDIEPLVCRLLGLRLPQGVEGRAPGWLLRGLNPPPGKGSGWPASP
jgi:predicted AlkP superfamily pyrophosphatase or phosphodiesterase